VRKVVVAWTVVRKVVVAWTVGGGSGYHSSRKVLLALFVCVFAKKHRRFVLYFRGLLQLLGPFWTAILEVFLRSIFPFFWPFKKTHLPNFKS